MSTWRSMKRDARVATVPGGWRVVAIVVWLVGVSGVASAQTAEGPYVGVSLVGDLLRRGFYEGGGIGRQDASDEALGFSLRLGVPLGAQWGVETEFVRPAAVERGFPDGPLPLFLQSALPVGPFRYQVETSERTTSFVATAWARHAMSVRTSLVFHGGLAVHRYWQLTDASFSIFESGPIRPGISIFPVPTPTRTEAVSYSMRPVVGVEARIGMTEHVALVPSFRVHGIEGGVLMRPSVGLIWAF
jgi:hypothetical protein